MSNLTIGYIGTLMMLVLMFLGMPIYLCLGIVGFAGIFWLNGPQQALAALSPVAYQWSSYYELMTIPLFVLMGSFAFHSGISRSLYDAAYKTLGHLPGGLAIATVGASAGFAALSGSSIANSATMGAVAIPEMYRYGYDKKLAAGTVAAGGTLGGMIPPSTGFIVIGAITGQSIGKLFIAGLLPGLLMMMIFMTIILVRAKIDPKLAPPGPAFSSQEKLASLVELWAPLCVFVVVMGGMYIGIFTATEAAAVGAFAILVVILIRRRFTKKGIGSALDETLRTTAMLFVIFIGAGIFGLFITLAGVPAHAAQLVAALPVSRWVILIAILAFYIPLGMVTEILSGIIITVPIFYPIIVALGFDPIWFCVLVQVMGELGLITPPVGMNVYVLKGVTGLSLTDIFQGVMPFISSYTVILAILIIFPSITTWLPGMMK